MTARKRARTGQEARAPLKRLVRHGVRITLALVLIPTLLVPLYAVLPPVSTLMLVDWLRLRPVERRYVPLERISRAAIAAVVMSEDGRFCRHHGIDWRELLSELDRATSGRRPRGASTITMQTVKNLFLWPSRSYLRKALEIPLALYADLVWSKSRTVEIYLNIAEWGPGIYGIEAAAHHYFATTAARLTPRQAARLAASLPDPRHRNPKRAGSATRAVVRIIERRMRTAGTHLSCIEKTRPAP